MSEPDPQLVVCGTDTDVGKTVVSAWLVQGLKAHYWKPVQSGLDGGGDRHRVQTLLNLAPTGSCRRPSPSNSRSRPTGRLNWTAWFSTSRSQDRSPPGGGDRRRPDGSPDPAVAADRSAATLAVPIVLVARSDLGMNHTLLSLEACNGETCRCWG